MTEPQQELLKMLANILFGQSSGTEVNARITQEAKEQAVSALISSDYNTLSQNIRVIAAHAEISSLFEEIPFTTFKGYASAYYYPDPIKRSMGDVDFIVEAGRYAEAIEKLESAGWKKVILSTNDT